MGLFFARNLYRDAFSDNPHRPEHEDKTRKPRITSRVDGEPVSAQERCQIAEPFSGRSG